MTHVRNKNKLHKVACRGFLVGRGLFTKGFCLGVAFFWALFCPCCALQATRGGCRVLPMVPEPAQKRPQPHCSQAGPKSFPQYAQIYFLEATLLGIHVFTFFPKHAYA